MAGQVEVVLQWLGILQLDSTRQVVTSSMMRSLRVAEIQKFIMPQRARPEMTQKSSVGL